jgi:HD-GYP domain-containing protein (c-di-GMP phosphodiesterase class II)
MQKKYPEGQQMKKDRLSIWEAPFMRRSGIVYFLISLVPLAILTYFFEIYIFPILSVQQHRYLIYGLTSLIYFLLFLSFLGYIILRQDASNTIKTFDSHNKKVNKLLSISLALSSTIHLDVLLNDILNAAVELLEAEAGSLLIYEEESNQLVFKVTSGEMSDKLRAIRLEPGQGVAGWVAMSRKPVIVNNADLDSRFDSSIDQLTGFHTQSILCVPLLFKEQLLGVLEIVNKIGKPAFDLGDQQMLLSLASEASVALTNAFYYEAQQNFFAHITEILIKGMENNEVWRDHLKNVAKYSDLIARRLNLSQQERRDIHFAALLHDIGMINLVPTSKLTEAMKRSHPEEGAKMIKPITIWRSLYPMILCHHERWDGKGYPQGLSGHKIPLGARIISLAETYDTISNFYSYNYNKNKKENIEEIKRCAGSQFDPELAELFLTILEGESVRIDEK